MVCYKSKLTITISNHINYISMYVYILIYILKSECKSMLHRQEGCNKGLTWRTVCLPEHMLVISRRTKRAVTIGVSVTSSVNETISSFPAKAGLVNRRHFVSRFMTLLLMVKSAEFTCQNIINEIAMLKDALWGLLQCCGPFANW